MPKLVADLVVQPACRLHPTQTVAELLTAGIDCSGIRLVVDEGRALGHVPDQALLAALARGARYGGRTVSELMSPLPSALPGNATLADAAGALAAASAGFLPVEDGAGCLLGVVTTSSVLAALAPAAGNGAERLPLEQATSAWQSLQAAGVLIVALDLDGRVVWINRRGGEILGYDESALRGRDWFELTRPAPMRAAARERFSRLLRDAEPGDGTEQVLHSRDGEQIVVQLHESLLRGSGGEVVGVLLAGDDVTERQRLYEALQATQEALRRSQENLERAQRVAGTGSWHINVGSGTLEWSAETYRVFGIADGEEMTYERFLAAIHHDDRGLVDEAWRRALAGEAYDVEHRIVVDGDVRWVRERAELRRGPDGRLLAGIGTVQDITEQKLAEAELRLGAKVLDATAEGVVITDADNRIIAVNPAFTRITGYSAEEVMGRTPRILRSDRHDRAFYQSMWLAAHEQGYWQGEIWNRRKNGELFPELLTLSVVRDATGKITNYVGLFSDISRAKETEAHLQRLAHYDALTDLPNRVLLNLRLAHAMERVERGGELVALLVLDVDRFKTVNDSLGHPAGDELLVQVARRLRLRIRAEDTLARLGGDEFAIILDRVRRPDDAAHFAEGVIDLLNQPFHLGGGQEVFVGASLGISIFPLDTHDPTQLVRNADAALYQAKEAGRNGYRFYTAELTRSAQERLALESALRRALAREELVLHYQPVVATASGAVIGAEALVRWQHPVEGMVSPARFIPLAEETGLIVPLGEWVLETACRQGRAWHDAGARMSIAVNLSFRQFRQGDLVEVVGDILARTGFPPEMLDLEITESAIMQDGEQAVAILGGLKRLGVRLSIDDFGTGYSSLAYLKRFAVDALKIDRSFVRDIVEDENDRMIVATVVAMAHQMRLGVIAEGVESEAQLDYLRSIGCEAFQGYLRGRPMSAAEFSELFRGELVR